MGRGHGDPITGVRSQRGSHSTRGSCGLLGTAPTSTCWHMATAGPSLVETVRCPLDCEVTNRDSAHRHG